MVMPEHRRALEQMVEEFYVPLYRYAYRLSGTANSAHDLTQETFCKAQVNLGQLRDPGRAKAWLFSILRNAYLQARRDEQQQKHVSLDGALELAAPVIEPLPEVDENQLQAALDELPEVFRTPIILYYFEEFSYRDIAEQMDLPLGTVMSRLARAKAHLRGRLQRPLDAENRGLTPPARQISEQNATPSRRVSDGL